MNNGRHFIPDSFRGEVFLNEPMNRRTSLRVGGPADIFAIPEDADDLKNLLNRLEHSAIPWITVGRGYNLLVRDGGVRGAVISLERFNRISCSGDGCIKAEAGAENLAVVRFAQERSLGGIGFIAGIPGSIGGAVRMNAGAYGESILDRTVSLTLCRDAEIREFPISSFSYGYRRLELEKTDVILSAELKLADCDPAITEEQIRKDLELRRQKHHVGFPSAGSFFKNPPGEASWRLIDRAGMRGAIRGGAQVSELHSNFLINLGNATADDFIELAQRVKNAVFSVTGILLEEEVRIIGDNRRSTGCEIA